MPKDKTESPSKARDRELASPFKLTRGFRKWMVIRDMADGLSTDAISKKYGTSYTSIQRFRNQNEAEIEALRREVSEEMRALWVSSKFYRLVEYQQTLEDIEESLAGLLALGATLGAQDMALIKEKRALLRNVAEELGQLPNRNQVNVQGASVTYQFEGVDPKNLT